MKSFQGTNFFGDIQVEQKLLFSVSIVLMFRIKKVDFRLDFTLEPVLKTM